MTEKEWRSAHKDRLKEYYRKYREKQKNVCTMDCFKCPFPDCRNSAPPTKAEKQMIRDAFGVDDPIRIGNQGNTHTTWDSRLCSSSGCGGVFPAIGGNDNDARNIRDHDTYTVRMGNLQGT